VQQSEALWTAVFQYMDLFWSFILIPNFVPFFIGSDKTGWDHMAGSKFTLLSNYYTDHSGLSSSVFQWIRSIDFVLYAMRTFNNHLTYFVLQENSCILLKIKCQFPSYLGLVYMFIISPPPPPVPQCFVHLAFQYSSLPFLPFSSQYSSNKTTFYILY